MSLVVFAVDAGGPLRAPRCPLLRKLSARKLAEAGCSEKEIQAITGHATSRMVAHYTKGADQRKRATAAITKLENTT